MTVAVEAPRVQFDGDDSDTTFDYPCRIMDANELHVYKTVTSTMVTTEQTYPDDYTISGIGDHGGGTVTFKTAPATGERVTLNRETPTTITIDLENIAVYSPEVIEATLDKLTRIAQDQEEGHSRTNPTSIAAEDEA